MSAPATPSSSNPLAYLGWDAAWESARAGFDPELGPGRVVRVDRGLWSVLTDRGLERVGLSGDLLDATGDDPVAAPCAGDWVLLRRWCDGRSTLEHVLPRRSAVVRAQASGSSTGQALAANLDAAVVVAGLDQEPSVSRIERLLT
ncbi:MAG: ribosome small subunit-dependent GTPase A, partial [Nocardioidaceae bacterium]